jgi:hypothetical protein
MSTATPPTVTVGPAELATYTRQLGAMLAAGVDVLRALRIAGQHARNERLLAASREIARRLEDGREFHEAIAPQPDLFDAFYIEMTRQGEADGQLGPALLAVADYLERSAGLGAPGPAASGGLSEGAAGLTMTTLGVLALGAGVIWAISAAELLPMAWLGPLAVLWSGICLLCGGGLLRRVRRPTPAAGLPPKTPARRLAETDAVVRGALDEQAEESELTAPSRPRRAPGLNGKGPTPEVAAFEPDDTPRFDP